MTDKVMPPRPGIGIRREERYTPCEVRLGGLEHDMKVVGQNGKGIDPPRATLDGPRQANQELVAVVIITHDVLSIVSAGHDVVEGTRVLTPSLAQHG